ncbi:YgaP family membrane protein [Rhodoblastus sp.]|uniref:YgaP family membrane protein n=1 Tax=Rhodoblastus sp. TaxID=1962975 RepID=UPI003F95B51C
MTVNNAVRALAGVMVLLSVALVYFVSPWFLLFTAFIGLNLVQSAFTGFCPPTFLFKKLGLKETK